MPRSYHNTMVLQRKAQKTKKNSIDDLTIIHKLTRVVVQQQQHAIKCYDGSESVPSLQSNRVETLIKAEAQLILDTVTVL